MANTKFDDLDSLSSEIEFQEFVPITKMPSLGLQDIMRSLETKNPSAITLDALIPRGELGKQVLQTILSKINNSVKYLSIRYNVLIPETRDYFIEWVSSNASLETLYVHGSGFDYPISLQLETAWKKNQFCHRTENNGYTLIRVPELPPVTEEPEEKPKTASKKTKK